MRCNQIPSLSPVSNIHQILQMLEAKITKLLVAESVGGGGGGGGGDSHMKGAGMLVVSLRGVNC